VINPRMRPSRPLRSSGQSGEPLVQRIGYEVVKQKNREQSSSWQKHPPVRRQYIVPLKDRQHISPTRYGFPNAEPEERERRFGQDVLRRQQGRLGERDAERLWQHVAP